MRNYSRFFNQHLICSIDDTHKESWRLTKNIEDLFTSWIDVKRLCLSAEQELEVKELFIKNAAYILLSYGKGHIFSCDMQQKIQDLVGPSDSVHNAQETIAVIRDEIIEIARNLHKEHLSELGRTMLHKAYC
jgi:hypothetical protein